MAHKKTVQGRSYPFLYNVTMTVGSRKSAKEFTQYVWQPYGETHGGAVMSASVPEKRTILTASYEPNKRDDVMMVQYLLKRIYQQGYKAEPRLNPQSGAAYLKIDGICGPKTQRAIEQFQLEMCRNGRSIATDGCVDPELGDSATSSISKTGYTISWLNKYFWVLYPWLAPDIRLDPECPPELKRAVASGSW